LVTAPVSLLRPQLGWTLPAADPQGLSDDEQRLVNGLSAKLTVQTAPMLLRWSYYDAEQRLQNLGISVPPQLAGVRTVVDWPRICVDPLVQRAQLAGFRLPKATEVDDELAEHWAANDMDGELPLAVLDSLVAGRGYLIVGSPDVAGDSPLVTVESPLNMAVMWDPRTRQVTDAYQSYEVEGVYRAVLYGRDQTVSMSRGEFGPWVIDNRDVHNFGEVPVVRLPNRARSSDREGRSEITAAVMSTTDSACRSLLGMEIAREVYSIPHLWIIGAPESAFVGSDGTAKSALEMAMTKVLALERDEEGQAPTIGQLTAFDPSVFTKIINEHAQLMSSYTGFPPSYFGQTTTANPATADAIRVGHNGLDRRAGQVQTQTTGPVRRVAQLIWRFAHGGASLPAELRRLEVDWVKAATPTPAATSDAVTKQISVGAIPPTSDVTLGELGYSPLQRARLAQDRAVDQAQQLESELTSSLAARQARAGNAIANDLAAASTPVTETPGQSGR
jgi:hypothetical protein